jgi:hypothetical protein
MGGPRRVQRNNTIIGGGKMSELLAKVVDEKGNPMAGASVVAIDTDSSTPAKYEGMTDTAGVVIIGIGPTNVYESRYELIATCERSDGKKLMGRTVSPSHSPGLVGLILSIVVTEASAGQRSNLASNTKKKRYSSMEALRIIKKRMEKTGRTNAILFSRYKIAYPRSGIVPKDVKDAHRKAIIAYLNNVPRTAVVLSAIVVARILKERYFDIERRRYNGSVDYLAAWAMRKGIISVYDKHLWGLLRLISKSNGYDPQEIDGQNPYLSVVHSTRFLNNVFKC